ncbi:MAG: hypothetical protein HETSPECPRED_010559 [Heterodermia speciosa]|uniref:Effector protein n=1 Tax=Heterodermia speciosa TaxID=116794 RepID=A0A8H3GC11_9LECA|nr:MAG: hypothetical protein HETSPECPRED_010559 [Heterodermia speciosa]
MISKFSLIILTVLTSALSLHLPFPQHHTLTNLSLPLQGPGPSRHDHRISCFDIKLIPVSLATCQPALQAFAARSDIDFQHTYGAHKKEERINLHSGRCTINLYPSRYSGFTVLSFREVIEYVTWVLERCESSRLGGNLYLGSAFYDWYLEVLGGREDSEQTS